METSESTHLKFVEFFRPMVADLAAYALTVRRQPPSSFELTRPQLNFINAASEQLEEQLDACRARNNTRWYKLRETIALLKNFSTAGYELLHVNYSLGHYDFDDKEAEFKEATEKHIAFITEVIRKSLLGFLSHCESLGLIQTELPFSRDLSEMNLGCFLPKNRSMPVTSSVKNRIDALSITVLNTTEDVKNFRTLARAKVSEWNGLDFDFLCETKFRILEVNMHTLQSMYDTYIMGSDMESENPDLKRLRGNITGALHLLRIASVYIHFYERHIRNKDSAIFTKLSNNDFSDYVDGIAFANIILKYLANYIAYLLTRGRSLCSTLLQKYCVNKTVQVKVPPYIGFHVRPSTLIASIVLHYGCSVKLILGESEYDASSSLNIIMANNYLDQKKRAYLAEKLNELDITQYEELIQNNLITQKEAARQVILKLASMDIVKIYKASFNLDNVNLDSYCNLKDYVFNAVVYLMNNDRQVGITFDTTVTFVGPEQAVNDISALAQANYCESERGEDLPLPKQLDYLNFRRKTIDQLKK